MNVRLPRRRGVIIALAAFALLDLLIFIASTAGLRINTTASMPLGLYRVHALGSAPVARGTLVAICPSASVLAVALPRNYLRAGSCGGNVEPFLKRIAAIGGDAVDVNAARVAVNGRALANSGRIARDCQGRPLPHVPSGRYVMAPGSVWLYAPVAASWDSRYYGPEPAANIVGVAEPVIIVGRGRACG